MPVLIGLVLVAAGAGLGWFSWKQWSRGERIAATETTRCAEVRGGECELVGSAQAAPGGALTAPFSELACVWHRNVIEEHYWDYEWRGSGRNRRRRRVRKTRKVSDEASAAPFTLADATGTATVHPHGAHIDAPVKVFDRFRPVEEEGSGWQRFFAGPLTGGDRTIGWAYEEWAIAPGQPLYVLGSATRTGADVALRHTDDVELLVSTRSEAELHKSTRRKALAGFVGGSVAAAAGLTVLLMQAL